MSSKTTNRPLVRGVEKVSTRTGEEITVKILRQQWVESDFRDNFKRSGGSWIENFLSSAYVVMGGTITVGIGSCSCPCFSMVARDAASLWLKGATSEHTFTVSKEELPPLVETVLKYNCEMTGDNVPLQEVFRGLEKIK